MKKSAVVTGITGQDGSYLSELLISEGYKVYGVKRRSSANSLGCSSHLQSDPNFEVVESDILDSAGLNRLCKTAKPDHFYNLAAQSHVASSFEQPEYTLQASGAAVLNCLEAIRQSGIHTRFYQASTSEMFGGQYGEVMCNEETPFNPRSPYGCAKLYGYHITKNYRESYKMFACSGILFNHECFFAETPVIIKTESGDIDIVYISSLVPNRKDISKDSTRLTKDYTDLGIKVWDGANFVNLKAVSRKKLNSLKNKEDQSKQITIAPNVSISTTPNHKLIKTETIIKQAKEIKEGDTLVIGKYPKIEYNKEITLEFAELLGLLLGDGYVDIGIRLTNNNVDIQNRFIYLAKKVFFNVSYSINSYVSGFGGTSTHIDLQGIPVSQSSYIREMLYEKRSKHKKVPGIVLNASPEVQLAFLKGYNLADGLKQDNTSYEYKSFKTNSALLAQGILYLISNTIGTGYCINTFEQNDKIYYQINFQSPDKEGAKGDHLKLPKEVVKKIINREEDNQHVFDIETETGVVMAGVGIGIIGNSERRGPNFVTRKITLGIGSILRGETSKLYLGNLKAKRDWGHAKDFIKGMYLMLNYKQPEDFVLATGETHSVEEFCKIAFEHSGLGDYSKYIEIDPKFYRPAEVDILLGDATKARTLLDWKPEISFTQLVKMMVDSDK